MVMALPPLPMQSWPPPPPALPPASSTALLPPSASSTPSSSLLPPPPPPPPTSSRASSTSSTILPDASVNVEVSLLAEGDSAVPWDLWAVPDQSPLNILRHVGHVQKKVREWDRIEREVREFCASPGVMAEGSKYGITIHGAHAMALYTYDLFDHQEGNFYYEENMDLRRWHAAGVFERSDILEAWKPHVTWMLNAMSKLPNFDGYVYRTRPLTPEELHGEYWVGRVVAFAAFTSTTVSEEHASGMARGIGVEASVVMRIRTFTGKDISRWSFYPDEQEMVLRPNLRFVVAVQPYKRTWPDLETGDPVEVVYVDLVEIRGSELVS
jgi:hypothetical protein